MRDYLTTPNLEKALALGAVATLMSVPRLSMGELPLEVYLPATFSAMSLVGGAVWAWGGRGGMVGPLPGRACLLWWVPVAITLAVAYVPLHLVVVDPVLRPALAGVSGHSAIPLQYPGTLRGRVAVVLWAAGFEMLFFNAGAMSFFTRLTGRPAVGVALAVAVRAGVSARQLFVAGVGGLPLVLAATVIHTAIACFLYARGGLPAASAFAAVSRLHLFLDLSG